MSLSGALAPVLSGSMIEPFGYVKTYATVGAIAILVSLIYIAVCGHGQIDISQEIGQNCEQGEENQPKEPLFEVEEEMLLNSEYSISS